MIPTIDAVRRAAYERWERRGGAHGSDRADWLAAEKQQRFERNYRVVAAERLDSGAPRAIGDPSRRRCRFCGQAAPRADFPSGTPVFPMFLGQGGPVAFDQCGDCSGLFAESLEPALARFLRPFLDGSTADRPGPAGIGVDAFKGLVKLALSVMPAREMDDHEDTVEWVSNPDHDFDLNVFLGISCAVHVSPVAFPSSWSALARKTDDDEPWPSMLYFLGLGHVVFQIPIPLAQRDLDHDGATTTVPDVFPPSPFGPEHDPIARLLLPIVSTQGVRDSYLQMS